MSAGSIVLVLKGYPRLSETFIAQEIHSLEKAGFTIHLISLRHPTSSKRHPVHDRIKATVSYLPEYLIDEPRRVFRAWRNARKLPGYGKAFASFLRDFRRDPTPNRGRRFGQALVLANEFPDNGSLIYSHFIHTPSSVSRYASEMLAMPWTASAHAKDIWTIPDWELREKLLNLQWIATCTKSGHEHLRSMAADPDKVKLVYHGLDLSRFRSSARKSNGRTGNTGEPVVFLTVARAVEKKGLDTMVEALARLPEDLNWQWRHIGVGEEWDKIKDLVGERGLSNRVAFLGDLPQQDVIAEYEAADCFVLPCRIARSGDRDGLPNVLMEAQSLGLMCISTPVSGVPELIENEKNGLLVQPDNPPELASALERAIRDPQLRVRLGNTGREIVNEKFDHDAAIGALVDLLENYATHAGTE